MTALKRVNSFVEVSLPESQFRIYPIAFRVKQIPLRGTSYVLCLEKGKQILGDASTRINQLMSCQKEVKFAAKQNQINFQVFHDRNMKCEWVLYSVTEVPNQSSDEGSQTAMRLIESATFDLRQCWMKYSKEKNKTFPELQVKFKKNGGLLKFCLLIAPELDVLNKIADKFLKDGEAETSASAEPPQLISKLSEQQPKAVKTTEQATIDQPKSGQPQKAVEIKEVYQQTQQIAYVEQTPAQELQVSFDAELQIKPKTVKEEHEVRQEEFLPLNSEEPMITIISKKVLQSLKLQESLNQNSSFLPAESLLEKQGVKSDGKQDKSILKAEYQTSLDQKVQEVLGNVRNKESLIAMMSKTEPIDEPKLKSPDQAPQPKSRKFTFFIAIFLAMAGLGLFVVGYNTNLFAGKSKKKRAKKSTH